MTLADRLIFAAANTWLYLRHCQLVWAYRKRRGWWPDIANPGRYSERMLWRKVVDHNPDFVVFSDKLACKDFIRARCPDLRIPRTLWVGSDADDIPDEVLQGDVFVKTNHASGFNFHIRRGEVDRVRLKKVTASWMRFPYGRTHGEWAYCKVVRKLFVEEAVGDPAASMVEIEVRACDGDFILGSVAGHNKRPEEWRLYTDEEGHPTHCLNASDTSVLAAFPEGLNITQAYAEAVRLTKILGRGLDYARFDFYWNGTLLHAGEVTIYPAAGLTEIDTPEVNHQVLKGWRVSLSGFMKNQHPWPVSVYAAAFRRAWAGR